MSFAEQLKKISDSLHEGKRTEDVQVLYDFLIRKSKEAAVSGSYSVEIYDDRLLNNDTAAALKIKLKEDGFKVTIAEDYHYTQHAGKTMMFCRINWD